MQRCPLCGEERLTVGRVCESCKCGIDDATFSNAVSDSLPTRQSSGMSTEVKTSIHGIAFAATRKHTQFKQPFVIEDVPTSPLQQSASPSTHPLQAQTQSTAFVLPMAQMPVQAPVPSHSSVASLPETPASSLPMPVHTPPYQPRLPKRLVWLAQKRPRFVLLLSTLLILVTTGASMLLLFTAHNTPTSFTTSAAPASLVLVQSQLDFGAIEQGKKAVLSIAIANKGEENLNWTIDTGGAAWMSVQSNGGTVSAQRPQITLDITADAASLPLGIYTTMLHVGSNGGNGNIAVSMQVVAPGAKKEARLAATPLVLDFQTMNVAQQAELAIAVSNTGNETLNWQADIGDSTWASIDISSGSIEQEGVPQAITVQVDTTDLAMGSHAAMVNISSNGGAASIPVKVTVATGGGVTSPTNAPAAFPSNPIATPVPSPTLAPVLSPTTTDTPAPTPTPSPTLAPTATPTPTPATMSISPTDFSGGQGCSFSVKTGWNCMIMLTNTSTSASLAWSASSTDSQVSFSPTSGTLAAGKTTNVAIGVAANTICPAQATLNFAYGAANPLAATWSCAAPTLAVTPATLTTADCTATSTSASSWQCSVVLSDDAGGALWSASSTIAVSFSPGSGTVYAGAQSRISLVINVCSPGTISFQGPSNTVGVAWSCTG